MGDYENVSGVRDDGTKIEVTNPKDPGYVSKTGKELMNKDITEAESPISMSNYGDPQNPFATQDKKFYGHFLPEHFKKTSIIGTTGRVR